MSSLQITDSEVIAFYAQHPALEINTMNRILVDILRKLSINIADTITESTNHKILSGLTDLTSNFQSFQQNYNRVNSDFLLKMHDFKREYVEDVKLIFGNSQMTLTDKMNSLIDKNAESLILRTSSIIQDIVPRSQDKLYAQIDSCIQQMHTGIRADTARLADAVGKDKDDTGIKDFIATVETQFNRTINGLQQPIFSYIQSSEERTMTGIQAITEKINAQHATSETLHGEMSTFLNKYKYNSHAKGSVSEIQLYTVLQQVFEYDEIIDCHGETASCDFKVNRLNKEKPSIAFENKDYTRSVNTDEIIKFERDIQLLKMHGIFVSQNSAITYKEQFHVDIINGLIHVYINKVNYSPELIKVAVNLVDSLSLILKKNEANNALDVDGSFVFSRNEMDELLDEYVRFTKQKTSLIELVKQNCKGVVDGLEDMHQLTAKRMLLKHQILQTEDTFKCPNCAVFSGKNKASLAAHTRVCKGGKA
jgi:hypothetical protein